MTRGTARARARLALVADESSGTASPRWKPARSEARRAVAERVEYSPYPRLAQNERRRAGSSCNRSPSGLCLLARASEVLGTQLRVTLRDVDGRATLIAVARVAWIEETEDGWHRMGLALLERRGREMARVRPAKRDVRAAREALGA